MEEIIKHLIRSFEEQINNIDYLLNWLYHQLPVTRQMINRYTKSIAPQMNKVYGW